MHTFVVNVLTWVLKLLSESGCFHTTEESRHRFMFYVCYKTENIKNNDCVVLVFFSKSNCVLKCNFELHFSTQCALVSAVPFVLQDM